MSKVQRALRAEELFKEIIALLPESVVRAVGGESVIRGKLDAILTLGKIDGRMTAYAYGDRVEGDRLIEAWQQIIDSIDSID